MHRTFSSSIVLLAVIAFATSAAAVAEAPSPVNATYVAPSATTVLAPDAKIGQLFTLNSTRPYILQRLTKRTYWFSSGHYATTFYVGSRGVLLFDPLEGHGAQILQAIAEVTKLPVTAVVYSHDHADHIADAAIIRDASARCDVRCVQPAALTRRHITAGRAASCERRAGRRRGRWSASPASAARRGPRGRGA